MRKLLCKIAPPATIMFAKTIFVAALVLAGTSLTFVGNASAAPLCPPGHSYQECFYGG